MNSLKHLPAGGGTARGPCGTSSDAFAAPKLPPRPSALDFGRSSCLLSLEVNRLFPGQSPHPSGQLGSGSNPSLQLKSINPAQIHHSSSNPLPLLKSLSPAQIPQSSSNPSLQLKSIAPAQTRLKSISPAQIHHCGSSLSVQLKSFAPAQIHLPGAFSSRVSRGCC